jgi:hypothetical protein
MLRSGWASAGFACIIPAGNVHGGAEAMAWSDDHRNPIADGGAEHDRAVGNSAEATRRPLRITLRRSLLVIAALAILMKGGLLPGVRSVCRRPGRGTTLSAWNTKSEGFSPVPCVSLRRVSYMPSSLCVCGRRIGSPRSRLISCAYRMCYGRKSTRLHTISAGDPDREFLTRCRFTSLQRRGWLKRERQPAAAVNPPKTRVNRLSS